MATIDVLYFAWLRERIDSPRERIETQAETVADLMAELTARSDRHASANGDRAARRRDIERD